MALRLTSGRARLHKVILALLLPTTMVGFAALSGGFGAQAGGAVPPPADAHSTTTHSEVAHSVDDSQDCFSSGLPSCTDTSSVFQETYTVDPATTSLTVTVIGAAGGDVANFPPAAGGSGAKVVATIVPDFTKAVDGVLILQLNVGSNGGNGNGNGYGGGYAAGAGGGESDISYCQYGVDTSNCQLTANPSQDPRLVVAGGGGGGGSNGYDREGSLGSGGTGGNAGVTSAGDAAGTGGAGAEGSGSAQGGVGGNAGLADATSPGVGAAGLFTSDCRDDDATGSAPVAGAPFQGGSGYDGGDYFGSDGGGGGGGWIGGGGGGSANCGDRATETVGGGGFSASGGGGGGAGLSYVESGATGVSESEAGISATPEIIIDATLAVPTISTDPTITVGTNSSVAGQATLTCHAGTWTNDGGAYTYEFDSGTTQLQTWTVAPTANATDTYSSALTDAGNPITCQVTDTGDGGTSDPAVSSNSVTLTVPPSAKPTNSTAPTITDADSASSEGYGAVLTCHPGTWSPTIPTLTYTYEFNLTVTFPYLPRVAVDQAASSTATYTSTSSDVTGAVSCEVVATNSAGSSSIVGSSNSIGITESAPVNETAPVLTGSGSTPGVASAGDTLTCTSKSGDWLPPSLGFDYTFFNGTTDLQDQSGNTYTVSLDDYAYGDNFFCEVDGYNYGGESANAAVSNSFTLTPIVPVVLNGPAIVNEKLVESYDAAVGDTVSCQPGIFFPTPTSETYEFDNGTTVIQAASSASTHKLVLADFTGDTITCKEIATDGAGPSLSATSSRTLTLLPFPAPSNSLAPAISGTPAVGQTLTCSNGTWAPSPTSYDYTFSSSGNEVQDGTLNTYTVQSSDLSGTGIGCSVVATDFGGPSGSVPSGNTITFSPTNSIAPTITGTPTVGFKLTCIPGTWAGGPTYTYEFLSGTTVLQTYGTTATYTPGTGQVGDLIHCSVKATNGVGSTTDVSDNTTPILKSQSITFHSTPPFRALIGQTYSLTAKSTSGLSVVFSITSPLVCTISDATVSLVGAGTCTVDADQSGNGTYGPAQTAAQVFAVAKVPTSLVAMTVSASPLLSKIRYSATLTAVPTYLSAIFPTYLSAMTVNFTTSSGTFLCSGVTNKKGLASCMGAKTTSTYSAVFAGTAMYASSTATGKIMKG